MKYNIHICFHFVNGDVSRAAEKQKQVQVVRVIKCIFTFNHRLKCFNILCTNRTPVNDDGYA